jgi:hypothetical protein
LRISPAGRSMSKPASSTRPMRPTTPTTSLSMRATLAAPDFGEHLDDEVAVRQAPQVMRATERDQGRAAARRQQRAPHARCRPADESGPARHRRSSGSRPRQPARQSAAAREDGGSLPRSLPRWVELRRAKPCGKVASRSGCPAPSKRAARSSGESPASGGSRTWRATPNGNVVSSSAPEREGRASPLAERADRPPRSGASSRGQDRPPPRRRRPRRPPTRTVPDRAPESRRPVRVASSRLRRRA